MAHKDYVRKKPTKQNNKKPTKQTRFPWRVAIVGLVLLVCLILLINKLSNDPEPVQTEVERVVEAEAPKPVTNKPKAVDDEIPPVPEEQWQYLDSLENNEVEVVAKDIKVPAIPYIMQCGAYKTHKLADSRRAQIALQGMKSRVYKASNSSWYRVVLGPYPFMREAEKDRNSLRRAKIEPCVIMRQNAI